MIVYYSIGGTPTLTAQGTPTLTTPKLIHRASQPDMCVSHRAIRRSRLNMSEAWGWGCPVWSQQDPRRQLRTSPHPRFRLLEVLFAWSGLG